MLALSTQIMRPIIYYFPKGTFGDVEVKHTGELKKISLNNTLILSDAKGDAHLFDNKIEQIELLKKEKILKSTVLKLIEFKAKNDKETFNYQLQDYLEDLETWIETTDYIKKNAKIEVLNYFDEIQPYLELQYNVLIEHRTELKQRFIENNIKPFPNTESEHQIDAEILETNDSSVHLKNNKRQKHKLPQPKVEHVDQYLLEHVFNVDFSKINDV